MKMGTGAASCASHLADHLSLVNLLPFPHQQVAVVAVAGSASILVGDLNEIAVAAFVPASEAHPTTSRCHDRCADVVGDVDAPVHAPPTPAVARGEGSLGWPDQRAIAP